MPTTPRCRYIKTNGLTCKSPALHGESRCFYHRRQMLRHARFHSSSNPPGLTQHGEHLPLIPIEDHDSIQLALSMVINGLAIGHLEPLRAKALLYGLQIASINAKNTRLEPPNHYDLPLATQTDAVGDDLAQSGDTVDIAHPNIAWRRETEESQKFLDDDDDEDEYEDDDEEEDDEEEDDEKDEEEDDDDTDYDEEDEADDLKVFNEVKEFMRRHP